MFQFFRSLFSAAQSDRQPAVPAGQRVYAIGDIHGRLDLFEALIAEIEADDAAAEPARSTVILLGDLVDRGPDSAGVVRRARQWQASREVRILAGNHEEMFLQAAADHRYLDQWYANGGLATLASFPADDPRDVPHHYREFIAALPRYILLERFVIVHAGLNFTPRDPFEDTAAMLWTRSAFVDRRRIGDRRLICGHTPVSRDQLESSLFSDKIMLDNGCVYDEVRPDMGCLAALELESMTLFLQENIDI